MFKNTKAFCSFSVDDMPKAKQFYGQTLGLDVPYQLFLRLPYALALLALAGVVGRVRAPADLGKV